MASKNFDESELGSGLGHNVRTCACWQCHNARYWRDNPGILAPEAQARVSARFAVDKTDSRDHDLDIAVLKVWGDVFADIAVSERIDTQLHYRR